ncbi:MAG: hypothetical protein LBE35_08585 [Clostridiales bacterium]|jgi:hypothetical protein|nr:hypothetical protein [Clostridiales bacterium]
MNLHKHFVWLNRLFWVFLLGLVIFANGLLFVVTYIALFIFMTARVSLASGDRKVKIWLIISYFVIVVLQIIMLDVLIFNIAPYDQHVVGQFLRRILAVAALLLPVLVSRYIVAGKYSYFYLPSVEDAATIGLSGIADAATLIKRTAGSARNTGKKLRLKILKPAFLDLAKHSSFSYINNGSLTPAYFEKAEETLDDPNIYLIISKTGSPQAEIISLFTRQQYNHASLSFDLDLQTTISYNGGQNVYPPGLNMEMLEFFSKTPDSKILVYSLSCTREQKRLILDKIAEINEEGSAYNIMGLMLKRSYKPNIMFCSQFVYKMLDYAGLTYFSKPHGKVNPTDLVELDYYKKLKFEKEITLGTGENGGAE